MPDLRRHPLAAPRVSARPPSIQEATAMIFASDALFGAIRMARAAELRAWLQTEPNPVRARLIAALLETREAMR